MNREGFAKWLRSEYRPPIEQPNDEQGGFLIPTRYPSHKKGWINHFFRWLGYTFHNKEIYSLGIEYVNLQEQLRKHMQSVKHE